MSRRIAISLIRACDALLPGTGLILAGRSNLGVGALAVWSVVPAVLTTAVCAMDLHPIKGLLIGCSRS